ncbi:segregation/condensation protein A [Candidatus Woesearchaeota archaeon]|nr:segregation/condensation protein A [Candidatus Woesearchaeota archaeon]
MQQEIFDMLVKENEITWKTIIFDLIKSHRMDPWDIDISLLTAQYIEAIRHLKEMDFKIGGKVVLAAALLLKIKSKRLVGVELDEFDRLLAQSDPQTGSFYDDLEGGMRKPSDISEQERMTLIPRTPQPRKRKVSIYDLVGALEKALEVKKRRLIKSFPEVGIEAPHKARDITLSLKQVYNKILDLHLSTSRKKIFFSELIGKDAGKETKVHVFVPLLHLHNQRKVDLDQQQFLGEIDIHLLGNKGSIQDVTDIVEDTPKDTAKKNKKGNIKEVKEEVEEERSS